MDTNEGGFIRPLLTPPQSIASSTSKVDLPHPRTQPLKPGSSKESMFIRFLDENIMRIQRRHAMRTSQQQREGNDAGFTSFVQIAKELDTLLNLIWISGTRKPSCSTSSYPRRKVLDLTGSLRIIKASLQVPYRLSLALLVTEFLPESPPAPEATFRILGKLDTAFASLLQGRNVETGEALPGFERGKMVSTTEKVRIKSLVDQTRIVVVKAIRDFGGSTDAGDEPEDGDPEDAETTNDEDDDDLGLDLQDEMAEIDRQ